jgi:hypothetical protein
MINASLLHPSIMIVLRMSGSTQNLFLLMAKLSINLKKKDRKLLLVYLELTRFLFSEDTQKKKELLTPLKDLI